LEKQNKRIERAKQLSKLFQAPFIYINRVGGEDEILFDGSSFIVNNNDLILELKAFEAESKSIRLPAKLHNYDSYQPHQKILWESLFQPSLDQAGPLPRIRSWTTKDCEMAFKALSFGFQEYARKS